MGRYAAYVWPAFGVCAAIMAWLVVSSHRALGHEKRLLERLEAGGARRRRTTTSATADEVEGDA